MDLTLLAFAQAREQLGFTERQVEYSPEETPRMILSRAIPAFDPRGVRVAVDLEYHGWDDPIGSVRELALIPPVSGG